MKLFKFHLIDNFPPEHPWYKKVGANIVFFFSGMVVHQRTNKLNRRDLFQARLKLRRGDVVIAGNLHTLSHVFITGPVTHSLIYVGRRKFIHAIAEGVQYTTLHHVFTEYDTLAILRLPASTLHRRRIIRQAVHIAKQQIGKPYNFDFTNKKDSFFCTALVNYVYIQAGHDTRLKTLGRFSSPLEKVEREISTAVKALHPAKMVKGNFELVFLSHNLKLGKNKELQFNDV